MRGQWPHGLARGVSRRGGALTLSVLLVFVCACVRACVRACVPVCVRAWCAPIGLFRDGVLQREEMETAVAMEVFKYSNM